MKKWISKRLSTLIYCNLVRQRTILHEMMVLPDTTYRYAQLKLGVRMCELKAEILKALLPRQQSKSQKGIDCDWPEND